jgi:hypothetical protein
VLACVTVLLTACTGSSGSSAASGSLAPVSSAPASSASPSTPPSTPASPAPTSTPTPASPATGATSPAVAVAGAWSGTGALCPELQVKLGLAQGTSNTTYQVIEFVNHGQVACIMSGYPGVNLAGGTPTAPIGLPAAHAGPAAATVILQPGGVGNALLQITDAHTYATATCGPVQAQYLIVYRPDQAAPVQLAYGTTACSQPVHMLQISAISLGTGG